MHNKSVKYDTKTENGCTLIRTTKILTESEKNPGGWIRKREQNQKNNRQKKFLKFFGIPHVHWIIDTSAETCPVIISR